MTELLSSVIEAHGGLDRWHAAPFVRLRLSSGGLARGRPALRRSRHLDRRLDPLRPRPGRRRDAPARPLLGGDHEPWARLAVRFPDHLRTHSAEQVLFFDERRRLRRHDDTAEAFGDWARAAHLCTEHRDLGGLSVPTRRRVHPRGRGGRPRRRPLLVWIDVRDLTPSSSPELG